MEFDQINLTTHDHVDRRLVFGILGGVALLLAIFTLFNAISGFQTLKEQSDYRAKIRDLQQQAKTLTREDESVTAFDAEGAPLGTYELPEGTAASFPENGAVRKGKIAIKTLSLGPQDAHCCPTVKGITYLTLKGHKLVSLAR